LSDSAKRSNYDANGVVERSVEEELLDAFGGGAFKDRGVEDVLEKQTLAEALVKTKNDTATHSHSAGFEAWMRTRGDANRTIGVDDIVDAYGVVKGSYDEVRLPKIAAFETRRVVGEENAEKDGEGKKSNGVSQTFALSTTPIPNTLEWGQVLVHVRASPVNPADLAPGRGAEAGSNLVAEKRKNNG
jgi:trans-2-enoyl-CoA reductase